MARFSRMIEGVLGFLGHREKPCVQVELQQSDVKRILAAWHCASVEIGSADRSSDKVSFCVDDQDGLLAIIKDRTVTSVNSRGICEILAKYYGAKTNGVKLGVGTDSSGDVVVSAKVLRPAVPQRQLAKADGVFHLAPK